MAAGYRRSLRRYGAPAYCILLITTVCGRPFRFPPHTLPLRLSPPLLPIWRPDIGFGRVNNAALSARPVIKDRAPRDVQRSGPLPPSFSPYPSLFFQGRSLSPCNHIRVSLTTDESRFYYLLAAPPPFAGDQSSFPPSLVFFFRFVLGTQSRSLRPHAAMEK